MLHVHDLLAELDQNLLHLNVLIPLLVILLLEELLSLLVLLDFTLSHLKVNFEDRSLVDRVLVELGDLLDAALKQLYFLAIGTVVLRERLLECSVGILDLIELHLQLQVLVDLCLQEVVQLDSLLIKFLVGFCKFQIHHFLSDTFNVDIALTDLLSELTAKVISFLHDLSFGGIDNLLVLQHLILVFHDPLDILGRQEHKFLIVAPHRGLID